MLQKRGVLLKCRVDSGHREIEMMGCVCKCVCCLTSRSEIDRLYTKCQLVVAFLSRCPSLYLLLIRHWCSVSISGWLTYLCIFHCKCRTRWGGKFKNNIDCSRFTYVRHNCFILDVMRWWILWNSMWLEYNKNSISDILIWPFTPKAS